MPYYRDLFARVGFDPRTLQSVKDLERLPRLDKPAIRAHLDSLKATDHGPLSRYNTGGSSGEPLVFYLEAFEDLVRAGLPRAFYATVHRWRYANADPPLAAGALDDAASRITLCGDWCLGSRVEDAFLSGLAAVDHIR